MLDDDFDDYFDGPDIPEKKKTLTQEELDEIEDQKDTIVIHSHRKRNIIIGCVSVLVIALIILMFFRYGSPYVSDARKVGRIMNIEKRGFIIKTWEGEMISEFAIEDTTKVYQRDFIFSIENDSLAQEAMKLQGTGKSIALRYKEYHGVWPWRGSSKCIVTGIE